MDGAGVFKDILHRNAYFLLFYPWSLNSDSPKNNLIMSGHTIMYIYLETPCWPLEVPSGTRMRLWSPVSECWLQTQLPPGSGEQKQESQQFKADVSCM